MSRQGTDKFFQQMRQLVFKVSDVNKSIPFFKLVVNKRDKTLNCLWIGILLSLAADSFEFGKLGSLQTLALAQLQNFQNY